MSATEPTPCPKCGNPMEPGWLTSPRTSLIWSSRSPGPGVPTEKLTPMPWWKPVYVHSLRCRKCKILIMEYDNLLRPNMV